MDQRVLLVPQMQPLLKTHSANHSRMTNYNTTSVLTDDTNTIPNSDSEFSNKDNVLHEGNLSCESSVIATDLEVRIHCLRYKF